MVLNKENKYIVILGYQDFSNKFENLFEITGNGSLRADKTKLNEIREWISRDDTKHIILSLTGLKLADVNFKSTNKFDIRIAKSNKKILWQVYNVCFVTYISICNILKQRIDERLTKDVTESSIAAVASDNQQKANSILKETDILNNEMNHKAEPLQKKIGRGKNAKQMDFENGEVQLNEENISKDKSTKQNISMKRRSKKQERNSKAIHKEIAKAATEPQKMTNAPFSSNSEPEPTKDNSKIIANKKLTVDNSNLSNHEEESKIFLDDSAKSSSARDNSLSNDSNYH